MEKKRTGYQRYPSELKERAVRMVLIFSGQIQVTKASSRGGSTTRGGW